MTRLAFGHAPSRTNPNRCVCGELMLGDHGLEDGPSGEELRDAGMDRVEQSPAAGPWIAAANGWVRALSAGATFSAEDLCAQVGRPARPNMVGARLSALARQRLIEPVGYEKAERRERHASRMLTWRRR